MIQWNDVEDTRVGLAGRERRQSMLLRGGVLLAVLFIAGLFTISAMGENNPAQEEPPYFSNSDIEQYKMPADNKAPVTKANRTFTKEEKVKETKERHERESWCKRANSYERKIEKAQDEISEVEKELSVDNAGSKKGIALKKKLRKAEKQKEYAEKDLADLHEEARRKDIPPGWLRCQFE